MADTEREYNEGVTALIGKVDEEDVDRFIAHRPDLILRPCSCDVAPFRHVVGDVPGAGTQVHLMPQTSTRTITILTIESEHDG